MTEKILQQLEFVRDSLQRAMALHYSLVNRYTADPIDKNAIARDHANLNLEMGKIAVARAQIELYELGDNQ